MPMSRPGSTTAGQNAYSTSTQHQLQQQNSHHPHSHSPQLPASSLPQSSTSSGLPVPLTQSAALNAAARHAATDGRNNYTPTLSGPDPSVAGAGTPNQSLGRDYQHAARMPIARDMATPALQPVSMGPSRPTLGGALNTAAGVMRQPALLRRPDFVLESEGDRILSRKKLDELVRQVTGGDATGDG